MRYYPRIVTPRSKKITLLVKNCALLMEMISLLPVELQIQQSKSNADEGSTDELPALKALMEHEDTGYGDN